MSPSSRGAAFTREERSDVAGRGDPAAELDHTLDYHAALAMTGWERNGYLPSSRGAAFSREERSDVAGRGDPDVELVRALDCRAALAMTGWGSNDGVGEQ